MARTMRVLSLFSGIGGIDLGLERAGMEVVYQSEIDPYCVKVLAKHWPNVPNLGDVKTIRWEDLKDVEVIAGGYPCQPFSTAGKRKGEEDPRHLWPYVFDAIRAIRPHYALLENVRGHLSLGFGTVLGDLASIGFDAEWQVLPASAFGAPHHRDRVFIVAYPAFSDGRDSESQRMGEIFGQAAEPRECDRGKTSGSHWAEGGSDVPRVANGIPARVDRLRALGNAVVPQVAEFVGRRILAHAK